MRNGLLFMLMCLSAISCGLSEVGRTLSKNAGGSIWGDAPGNSAGAGNNIVPVCYMTAVDYPKGYDWRADAAKETVKCSLVVYTDGTPVMKVPVSEAYNVCSDPDMHRIVDGHLYTDYHFSGETMIKKDGTFLFSYAGEERISDMKVWNGDVFTLGESCSGAGFSFRKNGKTKMLRENGSLMSPLRSYGDSLGFAFYEEISSAAGNQLRYYSVYGTEVSQIALRDDLVRVWDAVQDGNGVVYLASLIGVSQPVIISGEKMMALEMPVGAAMMSCSMFMAGDEIGVEGIYRSSQGIRYSAVWISGECLVTFSGLTISALCTDRDGVFCALNPPDASSAGRIYRSGELYEMPRGYACIGSQSLDVVGGIMYVGLSSLDGGKPLLWKDGQIDSLRINGYISSVVCEDAGL